jgi:hypothetical protein
MPALPSASRNCEASGRSSARYSLEEMENHVEFL